MVLIGAFVIAGCAKAPTKEIEDTKAKIETVTNAETETYAKDDLETLHKNLTAALDEVKAQESKIIFRNYKKSIEMLAAVKADAEKVEAVASQRKSDAKDKALSAQRDAEAAVDEATANLEKATAGKETKAEIESYKADIGDLEESLAGLQQSIDQEKYSDALNSANIIKEKATSISNNIQQAMDKAKK